MTDKIKELSDKLAAIREDKHKRHDELTSKEESALTASIKSLMAELAASITEGANACSCEAKPHGMVQQVAVKNESVDYFEVGCLACPDRRAQGFTREQAVSKWNAGSFVKKA